MKHLSRVLTFFALFLGLVFLASCTQNTPSTDVQTQSETEPVKEEPAQQEEVAASSASDKLILQLTDGTVEIKLRPDLAPKHVERITTLANQGFYDGIVFHRVIDGFMAQTGDPTGTGTGGSDLPDLEQEFSAEPFNRGVIGMARTQNPNSANSQFFIMFKEGHFLNNQYTVWGEVTRGMEFVDKVKKGVGQSGIVQDPDKIVKMRTADKI